MVKKSVAGSTSSGVLTSQQTAIIDSIPRTTIDADKVFDLWLNSMAEEAKHISLLKGMDNNNETSSQDTEASRQLTQARNATVFGLEDIAC
ncbi:hypothetical protein C4D60_Mb09t10270 [Musa balbisiana]|uniref:Uncharacterized protein n=1 Tax=Musa balbisiana TaxID=52838 RepID=A0A4S8IHT5_MUSBA|nr:hypothetical protein C4D60_Mb09t10270 [Musa balbisiana]